MVPAVRLNAYMPGLPPGRRPPSDSHPPMTWAMSPSPEVDDRYLLRDLLWCGLCGLSMEPAVLSPDRRFYGCRSIHCPRPLVSAELLEALVWQAFLYLFADPTAELTTEEQRQALEHSLERVTVGADLGEVCYQWRDQV